MTLSATQHWTLIHAERARLAALLDTLTAPQWRSGSLCTVWTVEQVTAHLTAAAHTGRWGWLRSMVLAGFDSHTHNARRLAEHLGSTPEETRRRFHEAVDLTIAPTPDHPAWLGEVIVHGQDIARPLGIALEPDPMAVLEVARYFASKDFAVNSRTAVRGLHLQADDASFTSGEGPSVRGPLLSLVMAMAGRPGALDELAGEGVPELRSRIS